MDERYENAKSVNEARLERQDNAPYPEKRIENEDRDLC